VEDELCYVRIVGVSFYQDALRNCRPGEPVRFYHEPDNPHDEMAIRVESSAGKTIGYVPRTSPLRKLIHERGRGIAGTIASMGMSRACLVGAQISVVITDDVVAPVSYYPNRLPPEPPKGGFRYWVNTPAAAAQLAKRSL